MQSDGLVLVVDDDHDMRSYLELALMPVATVVTSDGRDALSYTPAVAFVDLLLGDSDALPLIEALIARGVRVVVSTGLAADSALVEQARQIGVGDFLYKPFSLKALRALAARLLPPG